MRGGGCNPNNTSTLSYYGTENNFITKTSPLMYTEMKHINTLYGENAVFVDIEGDGTINLEGQCIKFRVHAPTCLYYLGS
jgi:hypothetical protein